MTTDTTTLSGYLMDYYAALAENMPNPRLRKHEREDTFICVIRKEPFIHHYPEAYSPTTNPALALPIIEKIAKRFKIISIQTMGKTNATFIDLVYTNDVMDNKSYNIISVISDDFVTCALRALVAWKFPDGLPEIVYESEK